MPDDSEQDLKADHGPLVLSVILGSVSDPLWHDRAHAAEVAGHFETLSVGRTDAARRRMRLATDRGRDTALALDRSADLTDGAVLHWSDDLMIVVRIDAGPRLRLTPEGPAAALRLGYFCGNMHWKADFLDDQIDIHMDGPEDAYRARLEDAAILCTFTVERLEAPE